MGNLISNFRLSNTEQFKFKCKWFEISLSKPSWKGVFIILICFVGIIILANISMIEVAHILSTFASLFKK